MFEIEQYKDFIYKKIENLDKEDKKICKALMIREELGEYFLESNLKNKNTLDDLEKNIKNGFKSGLYKKPSDIFKVKADGCDYSKILDVFVDENMKQKYFHFIDKLNRFQVTAGYDRRSARINDYTYFIKNIFESMVNISKFSYLGYSLTEILLNNNQIAQEGYNHICYEINLDELITIALDFEDNEVEKAIEEVFLGENNIHTVEPYMIIGIIQSDNEKMYKLLGDFLLAAKLQEGVRQVICNCMDCGVPESFIYLLDVIVKHNLIRFSSVKRSVCTWIGIYEEDKVHRITPKIVNIMVEALKNKEYRNELLNSEDTIEFMVALWSIGFYDLNEVERYIDSLIEIGDEDKLIVSVYYISMINLNDYKYRLAIKIIEKYSKNIKLVAAYLPYYRDNLFYIKRIYYRECKDDSFYEDEEYYMNIHLDKEEALKHFDIFMNIFKSMDKSKIVISHNDKFPYENIVIEKSDIADILCCLAYIIDDEKIIDEVCPIIKNVPANERYKLLYLLLKNPKNKKQMNTLISFLGDRSQNTYEKAFEILNKLDLSQDEYTKIEKLYTRKSGDIRANLTALILKSDDTFLKSSIDRLLSSNKEELRIGALDILISIFKDENRASLYEDFKQKVKNIQNPTDKESVMIESICEEKIVHNSKKYDLYEKDLKLDTELLKSKLDEISTTKSEDTLSIKNKSINEIFNMEKERALEIIYKLSDTIEQNKDKKYTTFWGEELLIGDGIEIEYDYKINPIENLPYPDIWIDFYKKYIGDFLTLFNLVHYLNCEGDSIVKRMKNSVQNLFERDYSIDISHIKHEFSIKQIINALYATYYDKEIMYEIAKKVMSDIPEKVELNHLTLNKRNFLAMDMMQPFLYAIDLWQDDEQFLEAFLIKNKIDQLCDYKSIQQYQEYSLDNLFDYIKLYKMHLISKELLYKTIFEDIDLGRCISTLGEIAMSIHDDEYKTNVDDIRYEFTEEDEELYRYEDEYERYSKYLDINNQEDIDLIDEIYKTIIDVVLDVELKRGEMTTEFSNVIPNIRIIYSCKRLVQILKAMGSDTLNRGDAYFFGGSRRDIFSHLLKVCVPLKTDNKDVLADLLKDTQITKERIIEVCMYNLSWIDIISDYLDMKDLKRSCYYFIAHMNEDVDEKTEAIIKKYTPLEIEELKNGAFDIDWFKECYESLGEEMFYVLYDAAKYISDSNKHTRARYFCDAVTGKLDKNEVRKKITEKRNKDLLISYALIPLKDEKDLIQRYEYIQQFLKESKQFGAQRRASEKIACEMALRNLAINSGYKDSMRLTLNMENKLIENIKIYLEEHTIDDITVKLVIDEYGKGAIECVKNGKKLKSVPAKYKKDYYIVNLKNIVKKLKDQYSRAKKMMEDAMEDKEEFYFREIKTLIDNPVVNPILKNLVFIKDSVGVSNCEALGFFTDEGLVDFDGKVYALSDDNVVRVAHVFDLYANEVLHEYQKYLFEKQIKQPFKQVFRELYVKTDDELDKDTSLRYAGNQIQTQKTVSTLKSRRWICDYENGLQKIFYKENIVANIYAVADWFSPSDIEAPTLEGVSFYDRKSFEPKKIQEIPDIIFSEVMRDTDLAISVAHVGGVDPETSMSTIEMRREIFKFNLELFKLDNVEIKERHAVIKGCRGDYSVHLGSGVVHQIGGSAINVVAVQSSHRGKLFLPFIDEDPKTAEIMSKIVLFAEDKKIKDPYILNQIQNFK